MGGIVGLFVPTRLRSVTHPDICKGCFYLSRRDMYEKYLAYDPDCPNWVHKFMKRGK